MKLKKINLKKATFNGNGYDHPDVNLKKWYLVKDHGEWAAGKFTRQWYGLNFEGFYDAGSQFDPPGVNGSSLQELYEIVMH